MPLDTDYMKDQRIPVMMSADDVEAIDEWRRKHHQVAVDSVGVPDIRPHDEPLLERRVGDALRDVRRSRESSTRRPIGHELDAGKETPTTNVADNL